ncbi:GNAT family N-acetyltransferase [Streptomyces sp. H27-S2]|uniref:GNAT family N-acetyltransferase n=1 Tax=Streptomyces antarcticus TaxID=2996458 RepID=UPI002D1E447F|nr:GNAT family N-acetyltransferase [Streptomyces sp. H27-S2]
MAKYFAIIPGSLRTPPDGRGRTGPDRPRTQGRLDPLDLGRPARPGKLRRRLGRLPAKPPPRGGLHVHPRQPLRGHRRPRRPGHRRQHLALACVAALCADIAARGRTPSWSCSRDNRPSRLLAWSAGFRLTREYIHYATGPARTRAPLAG